ncbi:pimeloyl-ACP methyl ester carboxylesterase [Sedimentibacter acidaminivorans]|uniref:Pimeloyl-ACP methyl ester carboxylesterase n=1 Tax=Sedimentibacter acidaminivorans TaxID=913099 RepID=A0ABS4G9U1_9FIRM|nr:alpha/beta fold hydrolase [Sedimentibacter acidaminivorans]MBP1924455.1 pimeloyl-ACP methyl ester carboxylesterase [Sedimentibacter acidaminivorans]
MNKASKILLLHGAWHNGSCWMEVQQLLKEKGYESEALTLPGNGEDDDKVVTYDDYVKYVSEKINNQDKPVIVVGHSSAGHILQMAIPKANEKVEKVIFNNAWLLPHGKSQFDFVPDEIKEGMRTLAKESGDGAIPIDIMFVKGMLATEASEECIEALMGKLVTQPLVIMETKINANDFNQLNIPLVLLYCTKDKSVAPGAFLDMFKAQGQNEVVEIECDHEGLFTNPKVYTEGLIQCIEI